MSNKKKGKSSNRKPISRGELQQRYAQRVGLAPPPPKKRAYVMDEDFRDVADTNPAFVAALDVAPEDKQPLGIAPSYEPILRSYLRLSE